MTMTCAGKDLNNEHKSRIYHLLPEDSLMKCPVWVSGACLFTASCSCTGMHTIKLFKRGSKTFSKTEIAPKTGAESFLRNTELFHTCRQMASARSQI